MATRAKFFISGLTLLPGKDAGVKVDFQAVSRGDRNAGWAAATPIGQMTMTIQNPAAVAWWEEFMQSARATGRQPELYVDIAPSEDGWPGDGHKFRLGDFPENHYAHGNCGDCGLARDAETVEYEPGTSKVRSKGQSHPNG